MIVVDASVVVKLVLPEDDRVLAVRVLNDPGLAAPDFILIEAANVLIQNLRRGALERSDIGPALELIEALPIQLASSRPLVQRAFEVGAQLRHPIYDCLYFALAERLGCDLVTADNRFSSMGSAHGLRRIVTMEAFAASR